VSNNPKKQDGVFSSLAVRNLLFLGAAATLLLGPFPTQLFAPPIVSGWIQGHSQSLMVSPVISHG
jgi:hypothetical protein